MREQIILGAIQGIAEWLPVSSEGLLVLAKVNLFGGTQDIESLIKEALFLHLGTFFAALIYFRKDVLALLQVVSEVSSNPTSGVGETRKLLKFLIISTLISGGLGLSFLKLLSNLEESVAVTGRIATFIIGLLLVGTGLLQVRAKDAGFKRVVDLTNVDGILLGIAQGFAALPGFSRSGLTVSALLLRRFDKTAALRLSFLMSLPIVLAGNILLNYKYLTFAPDALIGLSISFLFGILTIHALLKLSQKVNFGYFVLAFASLTILSALI